MSKQTKESKGRDKSKGKKSKGQAGADDDFDDVLAELRASDVIAETSGSSSASSTNRSSTSTRSSGTAARDLTATAEEVS